MGRAEGERKGISPVAATFIVVAVGLAVVYLGVALANVGVVALAAGEYLLGLVALGLGIVLVLGPVAVLVSQLRALGRRGD